MSHSDSMIEGTVATASHHPSLFNTAAENHNENAQPAPQRHEVPDPKALLEQIRLHLCTALQASLDTEVLLHIFYNQLNKLTGLAGVEFSGKRERENTRVGTYAIHKFSYQLSTGSEDVGELTCYSRSRIDGLNIEVLEIAVSTLIYPLHHALLFQQALEQAETDSLTCLGNRLALDKTLPKLVAGANRHQRKLSVAMIDVDHFKKINDNHGHPTGDKVLEAVASIIKAECRGSDMSFRYGGEEFVVVMNNTDRQGATILAERIRLAVATVDVSTLDLPADSQITISGGVVQLNTEESGSAIIRRADQALYQAKRQGRNNIVSS